MCPKMPNRKLFTTFTAAFLVIQMFSPFLFYGNVSAVGPSVCPDESEGNGWTDHMGMADSDYTAPEGKVVSEVCIKGGSEGNSPNGYLKYFDTTGWYKVDSNNCVGAEGVGTASITVLQGDAPGNKCAGISHFSVRLTDEPVALVCEPDVNLVKNPGFESPVVTNSANWDIFAEGTPDLKWNVSWHGGSDTYNSQSRPENANLELHRGVNGWLSNSGSQYAELDTDWDGPGGSLNNEPASVKISQQLQTHPGYEYEIQYHFSARPGTSEAQNQLKVDFGDYDELHPAVGGGNTSWEVYTDTVVASAETTELAFTDHGTPDSRGTFLDDVSVRCLGPAVEPEPEPEPETLSEVTMCKVDSSDEPLEGWNLQLLGEKIESVTVTPDDTLANLTPSLSSDLPLDNYVLIASGTYSYRGGSGLLSDPGYSQRDDSADSAQGYYYGPYLPWVNVMQFDAPYQGALGITVNATPTDWGYFSPDHVYARGYLGYSGQFSFTSIDDNTLDNSGTMNVDIYKGYSGYTGENGCVTFKDVPYGEYVIEEILMPDWVNLEGKGAGVIVDAALVTFNLKNNYLLTPTPEGEVEGEDDGNIVTPTGTVAGAFDERSTTTMQGGVLGASDVLSDTGKNMLVSLALGFAMLGTVMVLNKSYLLKIKRFII